MEECTCNYAQKVRGFGCQVCNPDYYEGLKAFGYGAKAFSAGVAIGDNPYMGTDFKEDWDRGWRNQLRIGHTINT